MRPRRRTKNGEMCARRVGFTMPMRANLVVQSGAHNHGILVQSIPLLERARRGIPSWYGLFMTQGFEFRVFSRRQCGSLISG